jgi:ubiquinone/menaquinone biosynthesis C-methylase UbiE
MGIWADRILPRLVDRAMRGPEFSRLRERAAHGLGGVVLEIGFGSGLNLPHYPAGVERIMAVDPAMLGRDLAAERLEKCPIPVEFVGLDGASLPVEDASVDAVLSTWTLCTIPDVESALSEIRRVLKPGAAFHFVEHGLSPDAGVARWQHRLNGVQMALAGGCHIDRPIDSLVTGAGFKIDALENFYAKGPRTHAYMYGGRALRA